MGLVIEFSFMPRKIANLIGFVSAVSLLLILMAFLPDVVRGHFHKLSRFFETNPGMQPFVIFMFPVILIAGISWIWKLFSRPNDNQLTKED